MRFFVSVVFAAVMAITSVQADEGAAEKDVDLILSQQRQIRADILATPGKYRGMDEAGKAELLRKQQDLMTFLEGKESLSELNDKEKMDTFNTLEWISAQLNNEESERMICKREKPLGSNRAVRVCKTAAQLEAEREAARLNSNQGKSQH